MATLNAVSRFERPAAAVENTEGTEDQTTPTTREPLPAGHAVLMAYEDFVNKERRRKLVAEATVAGKTAVEAQQAEILDEEGDWTLYYTSRTGETGVLRGFGFAEYKEVGIVDLVLTTKPADYVRCFSNGGGSYQLPDAGVKQVSFLAQYGIDHLSIAWQAQAVIIMASQKEADLGDGRNKLDRFGGSYQLPNARFRPNDPALRDPRIMERGRGRRSFGWLFPSINQGVTSSTTTVQGPRLSRVQQLLAAKIGGATVAGAPKI